MELKEILAITGKPGLYKIVGTTKNGKIVESITDENKRFPVYAGDEVTTMDSVSIFTTGDDIPLKDVFKNIFDKEKGGQAIDHKSDDKTLKAYFEQVLPEYNKEKVYVSAMKKIISWYNILVSKNLLDFTEKPEETVIPENMDAAPVEEPEESTNPAKKTKVTTEKKVVKPKKDTVKKEK